MSTMSRQLARGARGLLYVWLPALLIAAWWYIPHGVSIYFPALWAVLDTFRHQWVFAQVRPELVPSLEHLAAGYALALAIGLLLGFILSRSARLYRMATPVVSFFRGLPAIALIPPLVLVLGLGGTFKVGIIALGGMQPVLLNTISGLGSVDALQLDTAAVYRLTFWQRITRVMLPAASPQIVAGARQALQVSILLMVASEFIASTSGVGFELLQAQQQFDGPAMWASMVLLGIIGIVLNVLFVLSERVVLRWYLGMRALETASR